MLHNVDWGVVDYREQLIEVHRYYPESRWVSTAMPPRISGLFHLAIPHRGFAIHPRLAPDHPYSPFHIYLSPAPVNRHYYVHPGESVARLCWCTPADWNPRWRLIVGVTAAMRFLNDYLAHRAN